MTVRVADSSAAALPECKNKHSDKTRRRQHNSYASIPNVPLTPTAFEKSTSIYQQFEQEELTLATKLAPAQPSCEAALWPQYMQSRSDAISAGGRRLTRHVASASTPGSPEPMAADLPEPVHHADACTKSRLRARRNSPDNVMSVITMDDLVGTGARDPTPSAGHDLCAFCRASLVQSKGPAGGALVPQLRRTRGGCASGRRRVVQERVGLPEGKLRGKDGADGPLGPSLTAPSNGHC